MSKPIKGSQTEKNLMKAFAGETQAAARYEYYAKIARKEGYIQISNIFSKTAQQENAHAKRFYRYLDGGEVEIKAGFSAPKLEMTRENLAMAAAGEKDEWTGTYPEFADMARHEGFNEIAAVFRLIASVEKVHEERFRKLLENIEDGTVFKRKGKVKWECLKCGYIVEGEEPPETCPACLHPKGYFEVVSG
ncbi:MAG TPA: rubrerythrin family protein [Bacteroidales bacterium]|nr:rubrerythrin family protein [Bacteroidales bacterium]